MAERSSGNDASSSLGLIARACERFDSRWAAGVEMTVEQLLAEMKLDPYSRDGLRVITALFPLELSRRGRRGDPISLDQEIKRFPELSRQFQGLLESVESVDAEHGSTVSNMTPVQVGPLGETVVAAPSSDSNPESSGRYVFRGLLGRGGCGEVWRAHDGELRRDVAVKLLRRDRLRSAEEVSGFLAEARKVASLKHPGIVSIFDVGTDEQGRLFLVSELAEGGTLAHRLHEGRMPVATAVNIAIQIARALHHAHLRGLVHRDVKPQNILVFEEDRAKLSDFGLATTEEEQLLESGGTVGTYAYMPPEQVRGDSHRADPRSDIYSLGAVLYEMLTGRRPFIAQSRDQYRDQILHRDVRPPRTVNDQLSVALERIVLKCMAREVTDRYTTALDLATALEETRRRAETRWNPLIAAALVAAIAVAAVFLGPDVLRRLAGRPPEGAKSGVLSAAPMAPTAPLTTEQRWKQGLGITPVELHWPGQRLRHRFAFVEDQGTISLASNLSQFVQFGTVPAAGPLRISTRLIRTNDFGGGGLFWNYRVEDDGMQLIAQADVLHLQKHFLGNGHYQWKLILCRGRLDPATTFFKEQVSVEANVPIVQGTAKTFEIAFTDGRLQTVRYDQQDMTSLVAEWNQLGFTAGDAPWGGYCTRSVEFSLPEIDRTNAGTEAGTP